MIIPSNSRTEASPIGRRDAVPTLATALGYAGLLPQALALLIIVVGGPSVRFTALSLAFAYAALIYSFLGGVWWGLAARAQAPVPPWVWVASVAPSLVSLGTAWPWATGKTWPGPSLLVLGTAIMLSVMVDIRLKRLDLTPAGWLSLRLPLSVGLGGLTIAIGLSTWWFG